MMLNNTGFRYIVFPLIFGLLASFAIQQVRGGNSSLPRTESASTTNDELVITPAISDREHVLWEGSDAVTVVEYFDLDCQSCRDLLAAEDELPDGIQSKLRLIYRPFPLVDIHPHSLDRAIIAECVSTVGGNSNFFSFLREASRSYRQNDPGNKWLLDLGSQFVADRALFDQCVTKKLTLDSINLSRAGGYATGVFSTPSFLVEDGREPLMKFDLLGPDTGSRLLENLVRDR
jgi:protein-disulfide isomerase